jgi:hypothetical protein
MYLVKQKTVNYFEGFNQVQRPTDMSKFHSEQLKTGNSSVRPIKQRQTSQSYCSIIGHWLLNA